MNRTIKPSAELSRAIRGGLIASNISVSWPLIIKQSSSGISISIDPTVLWGTPALVISPCDVNGNNIEVSTPRPVAEIYYRVRPLVARQYVTVTTGEMPPIRAINHVPVGWVPENYDHYPAPPGTPCLLIQDQRAQVTGASAYLYLLIPETPATADCATRNRASTNGANHDCGCNDPATTARTPTKAIMPHIMGSGINRQPLTVRRTINCTGTGARWTEGPVNLDGYGVCSIQARISPESESAWVNAVVSVRGGVDGNSYQAFTSDAVFTVSAAHLRNIGESGAGVIGEKYLDAFVTTAESGVIIEFIIHLGDRQE